MNSETHSSVAMRAKTLFQKGFVRPALDLLALELNKDPDQGDILILQALFFHSQGNWKDALSAIENASLLISLPIEGQLVLADCYSHLGKHDLALTTYEFLLAKKSIPDDYYAGLYAGFKRAKRTDLALAACRKAIKLCDENDEAYFGMAHCMSDLAYPPRQITALLKKAVSLAPDKSNYRISLVIQLWLTKCKKEAYDTLSNGSPQTLENVTCNCIARQLLDLCVWAGDIERCSLIGGMLAKLNQKRQGSHAS